MEGDFTRNSDDATQHFSGVLMQQGRVQVDADWNEQWAIQTRALRTALSDLIGPHGGPKDNLGFVLTVEDGVLRIATGPYYVDGIRCVAYPKDESPTLAIELGELGVDKGHHLVCLEVWDRHVSQLEAPAIRELALLGVDTASRAQTVWALKLFALSEEQVKELSTTLNNNDGTITTIDPTRAEALANKLCKPVRPWLRARAKQEERAEACARSPEARYRGPENQLYRVEIHRAPAALSKGGSQPPNPAPLFFFKWSRENGSVIFPIERCEGPEKNERADSTTVSVKLGHLGRDTRFGLVPGDIVEFVDERITNPQLGYIDEGEHDLGLSGPLGTVREVDPELGEVIVEVYSGDAFELADATQRPYLRRWDQREPRRDPKKEGPQRMLKGGAIPVYETELDEYWFELEQGVAVLFARAASKDEDPMSFRAGDCWSIPARVASADVVWPRAKASGNEQWRALPPHGVERHFAPLGIVKWEANGTASLVNRLQKVFAGLAAELVP